MAEMPNGQVTFLFTDIEGSTRNWEQHPVAMKSALARHHAIIGEAIAANRGHVFQVVGDAFCAAFATASDALNAAVAAQRSLQVEAWGEQIGELRVRMAIHTGIAEANDDGYFAPPTLNRLSRILDATHGGQIIISSLTRQLLADQLPADITLRDMGEHRLPDLARVERLFQPLAPGLASDFPPLKTLARPTNLPALATTLVGREHDSATLQALLRQPQTRLLTLTGPGGVGKTRLGMEVAANLLDQFNDGAYFVPLAGVSDPNLVVPTIAQTLGVKENASQPLTASLIDHLDDKQMLLMLDNFEQVVSAAPAIADLLTSAPTLKIIVSSREALHIYGEQEYAVSPLALPDPQRLPHPDQLAQYAAVALFVERARAVRPDFTLNAENAAAIAEICARLDGLPLAIELAAARSKLLNPQAMLGRLASRLDLLTSGPRDLPARQQAMRQTIDWGYDLLTKVEKRLFQQLAIFVGGFTLEAAEVVCTNVSLSEEVAESQPAPQTATRKQPSIVEGVALLMDKSMLYETSGGSAIPRLAMLETIREYALEKLAASGEMVTHQQRHASYYRQLAEQVEPELVGAQQANWLARLDQEHDNLRAALGWLLEHGSFEEGLRMAVALWRFWLAHSYLSEGSRWLRNALATSGTLPTLLRARAFSGAGALARSLGNYTEAEMLYQQCLAISRKLDDWQGVSVALNSLGLLALNQGDYTQAKALFEESSNIDLKVGDRQRRAISLNNLGGVALFEKEYAKAKAYFEESLVLRRRLGDEWGIANSLLNLGEVAYYQGNYPRAATLHRQSLTLKNELGDKSGIALCLEGLAGVLTAQDDAEQAAKLFGAANAIREAISAPLPPAERHRYDQSIATIHQQLDEQAFNAAWAEGEAMTPEQAVAYALAETEEVDGTAG